MKQDEVKVIVRSKYEIDKSKIEPRIIITEIPFDVNKAVLLRKMSDVIQLKGIEGIKMIRDESSRQGLRIVIDLRRDVNPDNIINFLLKQTDLQTSYNFNMVAISQGRPLQMGLVDILDAYITHQKEVITNRCNYDLEKSLKRLEIVKGLISMVSILDSVIATIRNSKNKADAKENIISKYGFTDIQAEAIVMLQLYRLTNTDIFALRTEQKELEQSIKQLKHILSSETALQKTIIAELSRVKEIVNIERKTQIEHEVEEVEVKTEEFIAKEDVMLLITHDGYLKRLSKKLFLLPLNPLN
ncbi:MAG: DNA gyrase subunit A [Christensenellales bacterium]